LRSPCSWLAWLSRPRACWQLPRRLLSTASRQSRRSSIRSSTSTSRSTCSSGDPRYNDRFVVGISPAAIAAEEKLHREYLARLQTVDRAALPVADQLSFDIFKTGREREIEGFKFPDELIPLNQFYSTPNSFAQLGSGNGMQPFKTVQDYDNFLKRLDGFVAWTDQAIVNMKQGVQRGYTLPKVLAERTVPQL